MRQLLFPAFAALAAATLAGAGLAQDDGAAPNGAPASQNAADLEPVPGEEAAPLTGEAADDVVARASAWLNGVTGLRGRFHQLNPDGSLSEGDFYLHRPGRLRFAYDSPSPLVIVSDGRTVAMIDSELETADRVALEQTPFSYLLRANVNLASDAEIRGVARQDGLVLISLDDPTGEIAGQIVLIFTEPDFALREWVAIDEFNQQTRVILSNLTRQANLDPRLFTYDLDTGSRAGTRRPGTR